MNRADALFRRYCDLRLRGMDSGEAQTTLKQHFAMLESTAKRTLAQRMSEWENNRTRPDLSADIRKTLQRASEALRAQASIVCEECDALNNPGTTRCNVCDMPLKAARNDLPYGNQANNEHYFDRFTSSSVLVLESPQARTFFEVHPQQRAQGITLGRPSHERDYRADYEIEGLAQMDYGISRIHAVVRYDGLSKTVKIVDMNSTNGTYLNGERLLPDQIYDLKYGDTLRLGKLELIVRFDTQ